MKGKMIVASFGLEAGQEVEITNEKAGKYFVIGKGISKCVPKDTVKVIK